MTSKHSRSTVRAALKRDDGDEVVQTFIKLALAADLSEQDTEELRNEVAERSKINKHTISKML